MEKQGSTGSGGGWGSLKSRESGCSRARVVQRSSKQSSWMSHRISEEIDDLQWYFSKVLEFPEVMIKDSWQQWEKLVVFVRNLGQKLRWIGW